MKLRTARSGTNAGHQFWGCSTYPECRCILNLNEEPDLGVEGTPVGALHRMAARSLRPGLQSVFFELLTVPVAELRTHKDNLERLGTIEGLHWRCEYVKPRASGSRDGAILRALVVLEKLVHRGSVTLLSAELEAALSTTPPTATPGSRSATRFRDFKFDSEVERKFCCEFLPAELGAAWERFVIPQVDLGSLVADSRLSESEQRVDFLVCHPRFEKPLVIEIDGVQHRGQIADHKRDEALIRGGYQVARIPASEVRSGHGPSLEGLLKYVSECVGHDRANPLWSATSRRAGQLQAVLLHALTNGVISAVAKKPVTVASDLVNVGDMSQPQLSATLADLSELIQRVGQLYGLKLLPGGFVNAGSSIPDLAVSFYGLIDGPRIMHVDDVALPFRLHHIHLPVEPGLPLMWSRDSIGYFLARIFRKPGFWEGQYEAIDRALRGADTIVLLPTGAGKSIAFQLASLLLPGPAIVVEPIRALMHDQVENLSLNYGIDRAIGLTSEIRGTARRAAYELLSGGEFLFAYVAPERFQIKEFREALRAMAKDSPIGVIVIDEAHCVSEWGHDFRTSYLRIGKSTRQFCSSRAGVPPLLALTGTASYAVLNDLQRELDIQGAAALVTPASFDRQELHFETLRCDSLGKEEALERILSGLLPSRFEVTREAFLNGDATRPGLVFCPFINSSYGVTQVKSILQHMGIRCDYYSGGRPKDFDNSRGGWDKHKREVSRRFKDDEVQVLACTKAFGMGIDKPNVRFTVHYCMPPSIEAFYQEAGRAGRDRGDAYCYVICSDEYARGHGTLLSKSMSIDQVRVERGKASRGEQDDILRLLFFQESSFRGIDHELRVIRAVLDQWMRADAEARRSGWLPLSPVNTQSNGGQIGAFNEDDAFSETERALHRLLVLTVIDDYEAVYKDSSFMVHPAKAPPEEIIDAYVKYVGSYQRGMCKTERQKAESIPQGNRVQFILGVSRLYIEFVYEVIEKGRRQAMDTMHQACLARDSNAFRQHVLDYLTHTEFSERLAEMSGDAHAGLALTADLLADAPEEIEAGRLRGQVARYLESYPDHPGLLLVRGLAESRCRDASTTVVRDNLDGFLANVGARYSIPAPETASAVSVGVETLGPSTVQTRTVLRRGRCALTVIATVMLRGISSH